jgi:hypothetical protein
MASSHGFLSSLQWLWVNRCCQPLLPAAAANETIIECGAD